MSSKRSISSVARALAVARGADQLDDRVEVVDRDEQALEDVRAALLLGRARTSCAGR